MKSIVRYFTGAGVGVGASRRMTMPAGVRSDSNGVVSGVGGAGAGVPFSATWWPSGECEPQETVAAAAARAAAMIPIVLLNESSEMAAGSYRQIDKYCRSIAATPAAG